MKRYVAEVIEDSDHKVNPGFVIDKSGFLSNDEKDEKQKDECSDHLFNTQSSQLYRIWEFFEGSSSMIINTSTEDDSKQATYKLSCPIDEYDFYSSFLFDVCDVYSQTDCWIDVTTCERTDETDD